MNIIYYIAHRNNGMTGYHHELHIRESVYIRMAQLSHYNYRCTAHARATITRLYSGNIIQANCSTF